jgi:predicted transposase YbfD/YdcC
MRTWARAKGVKRAKYVSPLFLSFLRGRWQGKHGEEQWSSEGLVASAGTYYFRLTPHAEIRIKRAADYGEASRGEDLKNSLFCPCAPAKKKPFLQIRCWPVRVNVPLMLIGRLATYQQGQRIASWRIISCKTVTRREVSDTGKVRKQIVYGISNLSLLQAPSPRMLALNQGHWGIENGLHYRRDRTLDEDRSQLRMGHAPHLQALLNNTAIGLLGSLGQDNLPRAQRAFEYQFDKALARFAG